MASLLRRELAALLQVQPSQVQSSCVQSLQSPNWQGSHSQVQSGAEAAELAGLAELVSARAKP
jgi:hypothetical protein